MSAFTPADWYWLVTGNTSHVYSSARATYVPVVDADFEAWLAPGRFPTRIASDSELFDVLAAQYPAGLGSIGTVAQRAGALLAGSTVAVTSIATPALNGAYGVSQQSMANIAYLQTALLASVVPGGGTTFAYSDATGADHSFTAPQFTSFAAAMLNYVFQLDRCAAGKSDTLPSPTLSIP